MIFTNMRHAKRAIFTVTVMLIVMSCADASPRVFALQDFENEVGVVATPDTTVAFGVSGLSPITDESIRVQSVELVGADPGFELIGIYATKQPLGAVRHHPRDCGYDLHPVDGIVLSRDAGGDSWQLAVVAGTSAIGTHVATGLNIHYVRNKVPGQAFLPYKMEVETVESMPEIETETPRHGPSEDPTNTPSLLPMGLDPRCWSD